MSNDYGNDVMRAVQTDARQRELYRMWAPTPQEKREEERRAKAYAFEHGDHQPDGTIGPAPGKYPYRLADNPVMQGGMTATGQRLQERAEIRGGELCVDKVASGHAIGYTPVTPPSPQIQRAMTAMEASLLSQSQQRLRIDQLRDMNSDGDVLVMQVAVAMSAKDAQLVRDQHAKNPEWMGRVLAQLQREAVYEMRSVFGIKALPE